MRVVLGVEKYMEVIIAQNGVGVNFGSTTSMLALWPSKSWLSLWKEMVHILS